MNSYTIHCTEEQTRKALELGAPIDDTGNPDDMSSITFIYEYDNGEYCIVFRPTAEQMIGWIEEISRIQINIERQFHGIEK